MVRVVHPGSQIPDPDLYFLRIPDPGTRIRIRNTGFVGAKKKTSVDLLEINSSMLFFVDVQ
jgi:hypothetical protein